MRKKASARVQMTRFKSDGDQVQNSCFRVARGGDGAPTPIAGLPAEAERPAGLARPHALHQPIGEQVMPSSGPFVSAVREQTKVFVSLASIIQ